MGGQLTKSTHQQQQQQSSNSSRTSQPTGSFHRRAPDSQSFSPSNTNSSSSGVSSDPSAKAIVVVNAGPSATSATLSGHLKKRLPVPLRPLIPIGQAQVNPNFPQLSPQPILDLGLDLEQELRTHAELVAREQGKLVEKIRDIDVQVTASSVTTGAERQRRFNKAVDNFGKFDEIDALIQRCESDIEKILTVFVQLNEALPDNLCLEQFALKV